MFIEYFSKTNTNKENSYMYYIIKKYICLFLKKFCRLNNYSYLCVTKAKRYEDIN